MRINANVISAMKDLSLEAQGGATFKTKQSGVGFAEVLQEVMDNINTTDNKVKTLQEQYLLGNNNVTLADVKVEEMKATLQVKALTHVISKGIAAYHELMNIGM